MERLISSVQLMSQHGLGHWYYCGAESYLMIMVKVVSHTLLCVCVCVFVCVYVCM